MKISNLKSQIYTPDSGRSARKRRTLPYSWFKSSSDDCFFRPTSLKAFILLKNLLLDMDSQLQTLKDPVGAQVCHLISPISNLISFHLSLFTFHFSQSRLWQERQNASHSTRSSSHFSLFPPHLHSNNIEPPAVTPGRPPLQTAQHRTPQ